MDALSVYLDLVVDPRLIQVDQDKFGAGLGIDNLHDKLFFQFRGQPRGRLGAAVSEYLGADEHEAEDDDLAHVEEVHDDVGVSSTASVFDIFPTIDKPVPSRESESASPKARPQVRPAWVTFSRGDALKLLAEAKAEIQRQREKSSLDPEGSIWLSYETDGTVKAETFVHTGKTYSTPDHQPSLRGVVCSCDQPSYVTYDRLAGAKLLSDLAGEFAAANFAN